MKKISFTLMFVACTLFAMAQTKNKVNIERVGDTIVKTIFIYVHDTVFTEKKAPAVAPVAAIKPTQKPVAKTQNKSEGSIEFPFSVSESKKVYFSKGNLQYQPATKTWRFAEHQYDFAGVDNTQISETTGAWVDLFGWGTGKNPCCISTDDAMYPKFEDWGHNAISNGGEKENVWRTLSIDEWSYLLQKRPKAGKLYALVRVDAKAGLMIFPDNFVLPKGIKLEFGYLNNVERYTMYFNELSISNFKKLESAGAVFLPQAGYRKGLEVTSSTGTSTRYWTSSANGSMYGATLYFGEKAIRTNSKTARNYGQPVRLVRNVPDDANGAFSVKK